MTRQTAVVFGLVVSSVLCVASTGFLIAAGLRVDALSDFAAPATIYLGGGALLAGVLGLAVFLGLVLREAQTRRDTMSEETPCG